MAAGMLLNVRHETRYDYDGDASQFVQLIRLTPRSHAGHKVLEWRVSRSVGGALQIFTDGLGNITHVASDRDALDGVTIVGEGRVQTEPTDGVVADGFEPLPPPYFLRETALTVRSEAIEAFARKATGWARDRAALTALMMALHERIGHEPGETYTDTAAASAFSAGAGAGQDHAHIFLTAARLIGAPARYVGGYVWPGEAAEAGERPFASHAWAEAWVEGTGWIGFDSANGVVAGPGHVRVATGLDYRQAAPVLGRWRGAAEEAMHVDGTIQATESNQ